jgi:hypothetical protein
MRLFSVDVRGNEVRMDAKQMKFSTLLRIVQFDTKDPTRAAEGMQLLFDAMLECTVPEDRMVMEIQVPDLTVGEVEELEQDWSTKWGAPEPEQEKA